MNEAKGLRIHITGVVQGVGFRPFVYSLASRLALTGWVRNTSAGVDIEVDGSLDSLQAFVRGLRDEAPPLARIDELSVTDRPTDGFSQFEILHSQPLENAFQPISPDVSVCPDCLRELFDPDDRRYLYPFINCTNCGPRFTIIKDIPYDRPKTTMAGFEMCPDCKGEYLDPTDRRFHAQPVACPICGPHIWLETVSNAEQDRDNFKIIARVSDAMHNAQRMLSDGKILAIKGLGGFHLACDAENEVAVGELRSRKLRVDKPFALMMADIETVKRQCIIDEAERDLLLSRERPIVILKRNPASTIATDVAPHQDTIGVMLPYTPLHYLLFSKDSAEQGKPIPTALVMTSGNLSEEPIATDNDEARRRLRSLADAFLMHDRPIHTRCDDSVVRVFHSPETQKITNQASNTDGSLYPIRRSRGYSPFPVLLAENAPPILAAGAELKNAFCITRDRYAFLSHHIGDLENYETLKSFTEGVEHFERLFRVRPEAIAYDLHPNYLASRYALERIESQNLPGIGVQHHHAHITACMAEHCLPADEKIIGVAFDGTGYGEDGAIWGGEFLLADYAGYQRMGHLKYAPLPGGDAAVRKPARIALSYLWQAGIPWDEALASVQILSVEESSVLHSQLDNSINTPLTSSMGRLFDAVAALVGVRQQVNYEAQAAIEFEALVDDRENGVYPLELIEAPEAEQAFQFDPVPLIRAVLQDHYAGVDKSIIAARFHNGLAEMVLEGCRCISRQTSVKTVALSGGVWQNIRLLERALNLLLKDGFRVYFHRTVPANDGGLSLGQAVTAAARLKNGY